MNKILLKNNILRKMKQDMYHGNYSLRDFFFRHWDVSFITRFDVMFYTNYIRFSMGDLYLPDFQGNTGIYALC